MKHCIETPEWASIGKTVYCYFFPDHAVCTHTIVGIEVDIRKDATYIRYRLSGRITSSSINSFHKEKRGAILESKRLAPKCERNLTYMNLK